MSYIELQKEADLYISPDLYISNWLLAYYIIYKLNNDLPNPYIIVVMSYIFILVVGVYIIFSCDLTKLNCQNILIALIVSTLVKGAIIFDLYSYENKYDLNSSLLFILFIIYIVYITMRGYSIYDIYKVENVINAKGPIVCYINKYIIKNKLFL